MDIPKKTLYETDFYQWTKQQAQLIKERRFSELDLENLVEEVEDMGSSERNGLTSHLKQLLMHLLKWQYQPQRQSRSWKDSIINHRYDVELILKCNPGLKPKVFECYQQAYQQAKTLAHRQTGIPVSDFPEQCPWGYTEVMDIDFLPQPPTH